MPGFHVSIAAMAKENGHVLYESVKKGVYRKWVSEGLLFGLSIPIDGYACNQLDVYTMTSAELVALCKEKAYKAIPPLFVIYFPRGAVKANLGSLRNFAISNSDSLRNFFYTSLRYQNRILRI